MSWATAIQNEEEEMMRKGEVLEGLRDRWTVTLIEQTAASLVSTGESLAKITVRTREDLHVLNGMLEDGHRGLPVTKQDLEELKLLIQETRVPVAVVVPVTDRAP